MFYICINQYINILYKYRRENHQHFTSSYQLSNNLAYHPYFWFDFSRMAAMSSVSNSGFTAIRGEVLRLRGYLKMGDTPQRLFYGGTWWTMKFGGFSPKALKLLVKKSRQYGDVGRNIKESEATQSGILRRIEGGSHVKPIFRMETRNFASEIGELVRRQAILGVRTPECQQMGRPQHILGYNPLLQQNEHWPKRSIVFRSC